MVGSRVNTVDLCASVCFVNHGRVPLLLESKEQCTSKQMLWFHTILYAAIASASFPSALFTEFPFYAKTVKNMGQHNCQGDFNLVSRVILCESSERHSDFLFIFFNQWSVFCQWSAQGVKVGINFVSLLVMKIFNCVNGFFIQIAKILLYSCYLDLE